MIKRNKNLIKVLAITMCMQLVTIPSITANAADNTTGASTNSTTKFTGDHFMYREYAVDSNGVSWEYGINYDNTINVALKEKTTKTNIVIPDTLNGHVVSGIADYAFLNKADNIQTIKISSSVTNIGSDAFKNCSKLADIEIPSSVNYIKANPFEGTPYLAKKQAESPLVIINNILIDGNTATGDITIPSNVTSINDQAFSASGLSIYDTENQDYSGCSKITSVTIPSNVQSIGRNAFYGCPELSKVTISGNPNLLYSVFANCKKLTDVEVPASLDIANAFNGTPWFNSSISDSNPFKIVNGTLKDGSNAEGDVVIPDNVTSITFDAFKDNDKITSVTIPSRVETIGKYAFSNCKNLRSITIHEGTLRESGWSYYGLNCIVEGAFSGCESLTSVELPASIDFIGPSAFSNCTNLEEVDLKLTRITEIKELTFHNCPKLKNVTFPETLDSIDDKAFDDTSLTSGFKK